MKQKDILIIVAVAIFGVIFALLLSNMIFVNAKAKSQEVEKIDSITTDFKDDAVKKYINSEAINPSQLIEVGQTDNKDPF